MPLGLLLNVFGSKLGAWVVCGLLALALGATWQIQQWRIAARDGRIAGLTAELRQATAANASCTETVRRLTVAKDAADRARDQALSAAGARKVEIVTRTRTLIKEVERASSQDECPVAGSLRAALVGLREFGRRPADGH